MRKVNVGVIQVCCNSDFDKNLSKAEAYIKKAANMGADIVVLPENICYIGSEGTVTGFAQNNNGQKAIDFFSRVAQENKIYIVAGTIPIPVSERNLKVFSRSIIFGSDGNIIHQYDKIHLFDVAVKKKATYTESNYIEAGALDGLKVVELPFGKVATLVCFDLRFPEAFHQLAQQGAEIIFLPAAFTEFTGQYHWETLLRARAVDNQLYIAASNQTGEHIPGRFSWGHSMMVDPWGTVVDSLQKEEGVLVTEIDLNDIYNRREQFPIFKAHKLQ